MQLASWPVLLEMHTEKSGLELKSQHSQLLPTSAYTFSGKLSALHPSFGKKTQEGGVTGPPKIVCRTRIQPE